MPPKRQAKRSAAKPLRKGAPRFTGLGKRPARGRTESKRSGFAATVSRVKGGTEDREDATLTWEYILPTGLSATTGILFCIKGNSIYRPGGIATVGLGVTTNPVGYARMYTQYKLAHVMSSSIVVDVWAVSATVAGGVPTSGVVSMPLRVGIVPAQSTAAIAYAAGNVASIGGYPHSSTAFRNNTVSTRNRGSAGLLLTGVGRHSDAETVSGDYSAATGGDPAAPWYYTVGIENPSTTMNASVLEARIRVEYKVRFYEPVDQAVMLDRDRFGNEGSGADLALGTSAETKRVGSLPHSYASETKGAPSRASHATGEKAASTAAGQQTASLGLIESKGVARTAVASCKDDRSTYRVDTDDWDSEEEDAYYQWKAELRQQRKAAALKTPAPTTVGAGAGAKSLAPGPA